MALPQGINFRQTLAFVTDGANETAEVEDSPGSGTASANYPHTSTQGNNIGWESGTALEVRNRSNSGADVRLRGIVNNPDATNDYRIDLPSAGSYAVRIGAGDGEYTGECKVELFDTNSSLGVLCNGTTSAANRFFDADGTDLTAANWPSQNTLVQVTFATTICRFRNGGGTGIDGKLAHVYIEAAAGAAANAVPGIIMRLRTRMNA